MAANVGRQIDGAGSCAAVQTTQPQPTDTPSSQDEPLQQVLERIQSLMQQKLGAAGGASDFPSDGPGTVNELQLLASLQAAFTLLQTLPARAQAEAESAQKAYTTAPLKDPRSQESEICGALLRKAQETKALIDRLIVTLRASSTTG